MLLKINEIEFSLARLNNSLPLFPPWILLATGGPALMKRITGNTCTQKQHYYCQLTDDESLRLPIAFWEAAGR